MGLYRKKSSQKLRKNCLNKITKKMLAFIILLLIDLYLIWMLVEYPGMVLVLGPGVLAITVCLFWVVKNKVSGKNKK